MDGGYSEEHNMSDAQQYSDSLAAAVEKAAKSVVTVDARGRLPATGIVWSANGEILTADHVVQRDDNIKVTLPDGTTHSATVVGRDPTSDLALLKVDAGGLNVPEFFEGLKVGHVIFAVGRPDDVQATLGSVIGLGGPMSGRRHQVAAYVWTDVTMYPGFSGGPLIDASGRVAGLNSSALSRGASMAIPVAVLRNVADALHKDGRVKRGFLGISTQPVSLAEGAAEKLGQATGLMIISAEKDGPADKGGLLQGDVLVGLGAHAVADIDDLQAALGPDTVAQATRVKIVRGGEVKEVTVTVGMRE
jgi:S1-C subfamily serine protease